MCVPINLLHHYLLSPFHKMQYWQLLIHYVHVSKQDRIPREAAVWAAVWRDYRSMLCFLSGGCS